MATFLQLRSLRWRLLLLSMARSRRLPRLRAAFFCVLSWTPLRLHGSRASPAHLPWGQGRVGEGARGEGPGEGKHAFESATGRGTWIYMLQDIDETMMTY